MAKFAPRGTDLAKCSDGAVGPDGGVLLLEDSQKFFDCDIGPDMLERFVLLEVHWNIATGKGDDGVLPIRSWKCADSMHNAGSPRGLLVVAKKAGDAFPAKLRALRVPESGRTLLSARIALASFWRAVSAANTKQLRHKIEASMTRSKASELELGKVGWKLKGMFGVAIATNEAIGAPGRNGLEAGAVA